MRGWIRRRRGSGEASCTEVAAVLQIYLDGQTDDLTAQRVRRHLEHCRRCGLEVDTYRAIKTAIGRGSHEVDPDALERLRAFGARLAERGSATEPGSLA